MKTTNRAIVANIVFERKDGKIMITYPEYGISDTFENEDEANETIIYSIVEVLQQTNYNIRDLMKENPDKLTICIKTAVHSELTSNS